MKADPNTVPPSTPTPASAPTASLRHRAARAPATTRRAAPRPPAQPVPPGFLAELIQHTQEAVLVVDAGQRIIHANPGALRTFGFKLKELLGQTLDRLIPERFQAIHRQHVVRFLAGPERVRPMADEFRLIRGRRRDGREFLAQATVVKPSPGDGAGGVAAVLLRDVTGQAPWDNEPDESRNLMELVANDAPVLLWMSTPGRGAVFFNDTWLQFTGRGLHQEQGEGWLEGVHPDDRARVAEAAGRQMAQGRPFTLEYRLRRYDGEYRWVLDQARPRFRPDGSPAGYLGSCMDVTELRRARALEEIHRNLVEMTGAGGALRGVLEGVIDGVQRLCPGMLASVLLLDEDGRCFTEAVAPQLPDFYNAVIPGLEVGPTRGSCGAAAATGRRVVVTDIATDPLWAEARELAARAGLRACWSEPLPGPEGRIVGTFAAYFREPRSPTAEELALVTEFAKLATLAIERSRAAQALASSEARVRETERLYREAIAAAAAVPYKFDRTTGRYAFMGQDILQFTGYTAGEITPALWDTLVRERVMLGEATGLDAQEAIRRAECGALRQWRCELRIVTRSGEERWLEDSLTQLPGPNGQSLGAVGILQDITARKRADAAIKTLVSTTASGTGEEFFREAAREIARFFQARIGLVGELLPGENPRLRTLALWTGGEFHDALEYALAETPWARVADWETCIIRAGLRDRVPPHSRLRELGADSYIGVPVFDSQRQPLGLVAVLGDPAPAATEFELGVLRVFAARVGTEMERLRGVQALRESEARFRQRVEHTNDVVWIMDTRPLRLVYVSPAFERLWGLPAERVLGDPQLASRHLHPEDLPKVQRTLADLLAGAVAEFCVEYRIVRPDGGVRWLQDSGVAIRNERGEVIQLSGVAREITGRRLAEAALERERVRFTDLFEHAPIGIWEEDLTGVAMWLEELRRAGLSDLPAWLAVHPEALDHAWGLIRVLGVNREALRQTGAAPEAGDPAARRRLPDLTTEATRRAFAAELAALWRGETSVEVESESRGADGAAQRLLLRTWVATREGRADFSRVIVTAVDITGRHRAEEELRRLNAELESRVAERTREVQRQAAAMEATSDGMAIMRDSVCVYANQSLAAMFGYTPAALRGRNWRELFEPAEQERLQREVSAALRRAPHWRGEARGRRPDGSVFEVELTLSVTETGERICACRDITERKRQERTLRETARRLELATRSAGMGIWDSDLRREHIVWDERMMEIYGVTRAELTGTHLDWERRVHPEDLPRVSEQVRAMLEEGRPYDVEYRIVRGDGAVRHVRAAALPPPAAEGPPGRIVGITLDVTPMRAAEQALRESRDRLDAANVELRRAARLKDEFLAAMSHELRTPLTSILGLSEALEAGTYGPVSDRQTRALHTVAESGRHLLELINDVLDLAKVEAGQLTLQWHPCRAADLCRACLRLVENLARQKGQRVRLDIDPVDLQLEADARRLKQVLVNLLSNAVKFTPAGGELGLEVRGHAEAGTVEFAVWDKGIGIAAEDLPRLFQPFTQLDSSLARQFPGTGLGLTLVSRMVALHEGSVDVQSQPGTGSRFTVRLPWRQPAGLADASAAPGPEPAPRGQGQLVLLAEDNDANAELLRDYLAECGYRVARARDGAEAARLGGELRPDVVVMDVQMPRLDGLAATRQLRAATDPKVAGVPIIALSALALPGDRERCLEAGASHYLVKPCSLRDLAGLIHSQVGPPAPP